MAENTSDPIAAEAAAWSVDPELYRLYAGQSLGELREELLTVKARLRALRAAITVKVRREQQDAFLASLSPDDRAALRDRLIQEDE